MAKKPTARTRRDRWADWAVIGVLVVALLLGWAVMAYAEGQKSTFSDADQGLTLRYPKDWFQKADEKLIFQALDPSSDLYKTTYQVRVRPIDATLPPTSTLASVLNDASLSRAQEGTAYRLFDIVQGKDKDGLPTMEATYVYVAESTDLFSQKMPVVVMGLDVAVASGDKAYVFSLLADEDAYKKAEPEFRRVIKSAEIR